uniref:MG2 domain-containing protein n=1 Tax=Parastrongyloides trichosuri TaxID=131310 RepID=A0A0N4Z177_PARTI
MAIIQFFILLKNSFYIFIFLSITNIKFCISSDLFKKPFIVAPEFIPWDEVSNFIILPRWNSDYDIDYIFNVDIYDEDDEGKLLQSLNELVSGRSLNSIKIKNLPRSHLYYFKFKINNEIVEELKIYGGVDVKNIYIASDKKIYKPGENVKIMALPIKKDGTLYTGPLVFSILDSRGVKIITQRRYGITNQNFYNYNFNIPKFNCTGRWTVLVHPLESSKILSHHFTTTIFVQDITLPLYNLFMNVKPINNEWMYEVNIIAKHSIGKDAKGSIEIEGMCSQTNNISLIGPKVSYK